MYWRMITRSQKIGRASFLSLPPVPRRSEALEASSDASDILRYFIRVAFLTPVLSPPARASVFPPVVNFGTPSSQGERGEGGEGRDRPRELFAFSPLPPSTAAVYSTRKAFSLSVLPLRKWKRRDSTRNSEFPQL